MRYLESRSNLSGESSGASAPPRRSLPLAETSLLSRATQYLTPGYCPVALSTIVPKPSATPTSQRFPWGITVPPAITSSISVCLGFGSGEGTIDHAVPFQCNTRLVIFEGPNWSVSPNAQTSFADTAMTPRSWLEMVWVLGPPTLGLGTTVQLVPSQCSVRVFCGRSPFSASTKNPTAQASFGAIAVTPKRFICPLPGLGLGTTLYAVPSKCSINVAPRATVPTAQTSLVGSAEIPNIKPFKVDSSIVAVQEAPSKCSNRGKRLGKPPMVVRIEPAAHMLVAEIAVSPSRVG